MEAGPPRQAWRPWGLSRIVTPVMPRKPADGSVREQKLTGAPSRCHCGPIRHDNQNVPLSVSRVEEKHRWIHHSHLLGSVMPQRRDSASSNTVSAKVEDRPAVV